MDDQVMRETLIELLTKGSAHVTVEQALEGLPAGLRGKRPASGIHSVFEELEHMRLAQEDILRYTQDQGWVSPDWPQGYWPAEPEPTEEQWTDTIARFQADLREVVALVGDPARDLSARLPQGQGRTYLRQILLVADHNAYHLGQIVQTRKLLGAWTS